MNRPHPVHLVLLFLLATPRGFAGETAPPKPAEIQHAIGRGVAFLVETQNKDGSWGSARRTKDLNIYAPVPGSFQAYRAAVTALCVSALIEAAPQGEGARRAIERGEEWILRELPLLRRATPDVLYNIWGHAYGIQALVRILGRHPQDEPMRSRVKEAIRGQIDLLERYENIHGGWCYYDFAAHTQKPSDSSNSFVSATVLVALKEAKDAGVEAPRRIVERAIASIHRQELPDFAYLYGEYLRWQPRRGINRPAGSLGRSQACIVALRLWGDEKITDEVLRTWLRRLHDRNLWLDIGRKRPIPHESWFQVAGYFYYYGHYYGALCLEHLKPADRSPLQEGIASIIIALQEKDGSWWDYPLYDYHQQYGTAFALMTLLRCRG